MDGTLNGLYGQFIVEPAGAVYLDPVTGAPVKSGTNVKVVSSSGNFTAFRDVTLLFHDDDVVMNRDVMPYRKDVTGIRGINYKAAPFAERLAVNPDVSKVFSTVVHGDPGTPLITVALGEQIRLHVAAGVGQQPHVFSVDGHRYPFDINRAQFMNLASRQFAPGVTIDTLLEGGAGGVSGLPGDYLYRDNRNPFLEAGMWGILRVLPTPRAPTALTAILAAEQVNLTWVDNANDETGFRIERSTDSIFPAAATVTQAVGANATAFSDTTVTANTTFFFRVIASNAAGDSPSSNIAQVTVTVTPPPPPPPPPPTQPPVTGGGGGGGGGGFALPAPSVSLSGLTGTAPVINTTTATTITSATLTTTDGTVTVSIPAGTVMRTSIGTAVTSITVSPVTTNPPPPPSNSIVLNFNFGPDGATFNPSIPLTITYTNDQIPAGANEADLFLAFWDGSQWVKLDSTVNAQNNTVTAQVSHFTNIAIISPPAPPPPPPTPAPILEAPPAPEPAPSAPTPPAPVPAPTTEPALAPAPSAPPTGANWILISGLIVGVVAVISILLLVMRRRAD